jgi:uncharacterized membrane protein
VREVKVTFTGVALAGLGLSGLAAAAAPPSLVCTGNDPGWRLDLSGESARYASAGQATSDLRGRFASLEPLGVHAWRGRPVAGGGDLVAFVTQASCNDGQSADPQPYTVRVSLADGRLLAGCCRPASQAASEPAPPAPVASPPPPPADWTASLLQYLPAIKACVNERMRAEAVLFAAGRPGVGVRVLLRLQDERYADCEVLSMGSQPRIKGRPKGGALAPEERAALLTLLPGEPPRGPCDRNEPALDDKGNIFGWISRKGC